MTSLKLQKGATLRNAAPAPNDLRTIKHCVRCLFCWSKHMHTYPRFNWQAGCIAQSSVSLLCSAGAPIAQQSMRCVARANRWLPELFCAHTVFIRTLTNHSTTFPLSPSFHENLCKWHFEKIHRKILFPGIYIYIFAIGTGMLLHLTPPSLNLFIVFLWQNIASGRSILKWLVRLPNAGSKPYLPQVLNYLSW